MVVHDRCIFRRTFCSKNSVKPRRARWRCHHADAISTAGASKSRVPTPVYPLTTPTSRGVAFVVAAGFVVTCEHTVRDKTRVTVAGSPGQVVATCASDIALVSVPAVSGADMPLLDDEETTMPLASGKHVCISSASGDTVDATIVDMPGIMYSNSGAVLPALRLKLRDRTFVGGATTEGRHVAKGWSGSPVLDKKTDAVLGMIVHGSFGTCVENSMLEVVFAAPVGVIQCFVKSSLCAIMSGEKAFRPPLRAWRYEIAAIAPLTIQPLSSPRSFDALRESSACSGWRASCNALSGGARVIIAPPASALRRGDVIVKLGEFAVGWDGCISRWGMRTTVQAAFIGAERNSRVEVQVLQATGRSPADLRMVTVQLGRAEEAAINVPARRINCTLIAGDGDEESMRFTELSVEWLQERFGEGWAYSCDHDLYATVFGERGRECDSSAKTESTVIIDEDKTDEELVGSRVVAVAGEEVRSLHDMMRVAEKNTAETLVLELADGWITSLPRPLQVVHQDV